MSALERLQVLVRSHVPDWDDAQKMLKEIRGVLEENRDGRDISGEELQAIRHRHDEHGKCLSFVGLSEDCWVDVETLFQLLNFRDALINDLRQESTAYQRGVEDGKRLKVEEAVEIARGFLHTNQAVPEEEDFRTYE